MGQLKHLAAVAIPGILAPRIQNWNAETVFPVRQAFIQQCPGRRLTAMVVLDLLLLLAALLFLLPLNPVFSSLPAVVWVVAQLALAPAERRWAAWPLLFVLVLYGRSWWLNQMPHPVAPQDGVLLVGALLAAACVSPHRWQVLLRLQLLVLPVLLFQLGPSPVIADHLIREGRHWTPNHFAGANQGAYLLGILLLLAVAWFSQTAQPKWHRLCAGASASLAAVMVWQTGSRAALVAAGLAVALLWVHRGVGFSSTWKRGLALFGLGVVALTAKQLLRPSSIGIPGIDFSSDTGRIAIARCYGAIPFSGNNRFLYGIGFERSGEFCSDPIHGGVADHAHNIYLQLFASSGVLGISGLVLLLALLLHAWCLVGTDMDLIPRTAGQLVLLYTLIQGCLDLSLVHWPVTLVFTGLMLGIPLSSTRWSVVESPPNINP